MRYPVPQPAADAGGQHWGEHSVFTSASGHGAQVRTSPSHGEQHDPAEEELVTFNRESPFFLEGDDPQV